MAIASLYLSITALLVPPALVLYLSTYLKLFGLYLDPDWWLSMVTILAIATLMLAIGAVVLGHKACKSIAVGQGALMGKGRALTGLLLGYPTAILLGLFILFGLPISPLGPFIDTSKVAARQASAVGCLRSLKSAAEIYKETYGRGYPLTLAVLGGPDKGRAQDASGANLIDEVLARGQKAGYVYLYRVTARDKNHFPSAYAVSVSPIQGCGTGYGNCYFMDETGIIRFETERPASKDSPPLAP